MSEDYSILVALELSKEGDAPIIAKAKKFQQENKAKMVLVHAVEHMSNYGAAYGVSAGVDIEEELIKEAEQAMQNLGKELSIPKEQQIIRIGPAKQVILEEAEQQKSDLVIMGSHGRHGVRLLLGSTANAVLHNANCDVLAVRVKG
jgi:universal stress protein A